MIRLARAARSPRALVAVALVLTGCSSPAPGPSSPSVSAVEPSAVSSAPASETGSASPSESGSASAAPSVSGPAWAELPDAPIARLEMGTAAHDGRIWLAGGLSPFGEALNEVDVFDPASGEWSPGPALPTGVHHASLVSDGDRLVLVGGYLGSSFDDPTDIVLVLLNGAEGWESGPLLPSPRGAGAAAWDGSRVIFAGGVGPDGVSADIFALTDGEWGRLGAMGRQREHLAAASDGEGRTWLLGGRVGGLNSNLSEVDLVEGDAVVALDPLPTARGGVAAFFLPSLGACLTGGETPTQALTEVECVGDDGSVTTAASMRVGRHGHGAGVIDSDAFVVLGGPTPALSAHASVERLEGSP